MTLREFLIRIGIATAVVYLGFGVQVILLVKGWMAPNRMTIWGFVVVSLVILAVAPLDSSGSSIFAAVVGVVAVTLTCRFMTGFTVSLYEASRRNREVIKALGEKWRQRH
jgi:hypothetical protein